MPYYDSLAKADRFAMLVEIDSGGTIRRFATVDVSTSDATHFDGVLTNRISVSSRLDIPTFRYSQQSVQFNIVNSDRLQESGLRDGDSVTIYLWCNGASYTDIQNNGVVFNGSLSINSYSKTAWSCSATDGYKSSIETIPSKIIDTTRYPNHRLTGGGGSVSGKALPLVFGQWSKGVPLLPIDTSGFIYLATQHNVQSVDADYTATTYNVYDKDGGVISASNYTVSYEIDAKGTTITKFDFTSDQTSNEPLSCSINGITGEISGSEALIEHPADITKFLIEKYSSFSISNSDISAFKSITPSIKYSSIINIQTYGVDIIDRILTQCLSTRRTDRSGYFGVGVFDITSPSRSKINIDLDATTDPVITFTSETYIVNELLVKYGLNPTTGQYENELLLNRYNQTLCEKSYYRYGAYPQHVLQLPDVQEDATARTIAVRFLNLRALRHEQVTARVPHYIGFPLPLLSVSEITSELPATGWDNERCVLVDKSIDSYGTTCKWWRINS